MYNVWMTILFGYAVAIPMAFLFAFTFHFGLQGVWIGIAVSYACMTSVIHFKIKNTDWEKIS